MRYTAILAALGAALLSAGPGRAEEIPQPVGHEVLEPPRAEAEPSEVAPDPGEPEAAPPPAAAAPAPAPAAAAAPADRSALDVALWLGGGDERVVLGTSFGGSAGPLAFGVLADVAAEVGGRHHHDRGDWDDDDDDDDWCRELSNGRCLRRVDAALAGYAGVRHRTGPLFGASRLRLELLGELGWTVSAVDERTVVDGRERWSDDARAYPFAGVRGTAVLTLFRAAYLGLGADARQGLAGRVCVDTDGGCTHVGGPTASVFLIGGVEWDAGR